VTLAIARLGLAARLRRRDAKHAADDRPQCIAPVDAVAQVADRDGQPIECLVIHGESLRAVPTSLRHNAASQTLGRRSVVGRRRTGGPRTT
jgi:hypothetical protein